MKSFKRFPRPTVALAALAMTVLSSCNRGYGCPTNFSLGEVTESLFATVVALF